MLRLMGEMLKLIWWVVTGLFRSRASLETEILTLRHQLNVLQRKAPKRPVFSNFDRLVFASLYRLPGLGVRTMPSGHKSFILEYRPGGGGRGVATKRFTLGAYGKLTPEQARKDANKLLLRVKNGEDPQQEKTAARFVPVYSFWDFQTGYTRKS